ncbi:TauD/TfdA family dioxygenase [Streptomyces coeruleorubidus]|uniref:TauD/TfdA family dioxygenase n=1 Tax=Streptomyces coeruleorubidus TaxID=116188 RepID=A0ABZ0KGQ8_STRC4|nr:TauD/TfdA family dioxygenase [Streptomyces coeruleorubidus]WOT36892.1 TauD/TfdA family dioxygenase [Streptomyces coeruleorubidus]
MLSALFRRNRATTAPAPDGLPVLDAADTGDATDAAAWAAGRRNALRELVAERGALVVRGLGLRTPADVESVLRQVAERPVAEREAFAARDRHADGVYSSSAWPPNQTMCMHHELSYAFECPGLLMFACLEPPDEGGATAVADATEVLRALPAELVDRFAREGWLLDRAYNEGIGATLGQSFGTDDRDAVEAYCRAHAIDWSWQPDGSLRTRQHRPAVVRHPVSGRHCWFNQIAFLNEWTMAPEVREFLTEEYGPDGLPFNTRYGNGDPVPPDVVEQINKTYEAHTVRRPWQRGDLMLVDNIRTAHSREAYRGPRNIVVAMADPVRPGLPEPRTGREAA